MDTQLPTGLMGIGALLVVISGFAFMISRKYGRKLLILGLMIIILIPFLPIFSEFASSIFGLIPIWIVIPFGILFGFAIIRLSLKVFIGEMASGHLIDDLITIIVRVPVQKFAASILWLARILFGTRNRPL